MPNTASVGAGGGITGADIVNTAEKYSGVPYFEGNPQSNSGMDCSGLVQRVMADLGVSIPRTTSTQLAAAGSRNIGTNLSNALQGDILHYVGHEEIWIGGGKVFSEATNGTVAGIRNRTNWPIIGIVRYATAGPGPQVGGYGQTKPGQVTDPNAGSVPGLDPGKVSGQLVDIIPGANTVSGALTGIWDSLQGIVKAMAFLSDPKNWQRVGIALLGGALLIMALIKITKEA